MKVFWGLVAADVHHLDDVVFVAQIHVGDSGASGGVARHTFEARHDDVAVQGGFRFFAFFFQRVLLLHRQIGRAFFFYPGQLQNPVEMLKKYQSVKNFEAQSFERRNRKNGMSVTLRN